MKRPYFNEFERRCILTNNGLAYRLNLDLAQRKLGREIDRVLRPKLTPVMDSLEKSLNYIYAKINTGTSSRTAGRRRWR